MNFKKILLLASIIAVGLFTIKGVKTFAEDFWPGRGHVEVINKNIDTLTNRINEKNQLANHLKSELLKVQKESENSSKQVENLTNQLKQVEIDKQTAINQKIEEINQKIAEGNQKVAEKQAELDLANSSINSLQHEIDNLRNQLGIKDQALQDVEEIRKKTELAVQQTAN